LIYDSQGERVEFDAQEKKINVHAGNRPKSEISTLMSI